MRVIITQFTKQIQNLNHKWDLMRFMPPLVRPPSNPTMVSFNESSILEADIDVILQVHLTFIRREALIFVLGVQPSNIFLLLCAQTKESRP